MEASVRGEHCSARPGVEVFYVGLCRALDDQSPCVLIFMANVPVWREKTVKNRLFVLNSGNFHEMDNESSD